jgi:hypothetical protein
MPLALCVLVHDNSTVYSHFVADHSGQKIGLDPCLGLLLHRQVSCNGSVLHPKNIDIFKFFISKHYEDLKIKQQLSVQSAQTCTYLHHQIPTIGYTHVGTIIVTCICDTVSAVHFCNVMCFM